MRRLAVVLGSAVTAGLPVCLIGAGLAGAGAAAGAVAHRAGALARPVALGGGWGKPIEVPGSGALNRGGTAAVNSVSCAAPEGCSAGGFYGDQAGHLHVQAFVVNRT